MERVETFMRESAKNHSELSARVENGQTAFAVQSIADRADIRRGIKERHEENTQKLDALAHSVDCLAREMKKFQDRWTETLEETRERREQGKKLREAIIEKSVVASVWALLLFLAFSAWEYIKAHLK